VLAYIGVQGNTLQLVFRGTTDWLNWIENVDFPLVSLGFGNAPSGVSVHDGFRDAYNSVQSSVRSTIATVLSAHTINQVYISGHSLGGALATLGAVDLVQSGIIPSTIPVSVYTFGSPRVGNPSFATWYETLHITTYRVTYKNDEVVHLPFAWMGYGHVTQEVYFTSSTSSKLCSSTNGEDGSCADDVELWNYSTNDHTNYLGLNLEQGGC